MTENLTFQAGKNALSVIRDEGLQADRIKIIAGAAGGPKWLVLNHLDRVIFSQWLNRRKTPLFLIGSSIGAWRFAAASTQNPVETIETFQHEYIHQSYRSKPTPEEISATSAAILDTYLADTKAFDILHHPYIRINIMAVRSKWAVANDNKIRLTAGLALSFIANLISRKLLKFFFERALFSDPRQIPPFAHMDFFPIKTIPLTESNLKSALLASGSIPLVMSGISDICQAPEGIYRDGGVLDYHPDIPFTKHNDIVLFPHYTDKIIPGWMDKKLPWRKPSRDHMQNVVLVSPSKSFIDKLPHKKIPDRNDFYLFRGNQKERISYWYSVVDHSRQLGEEFLEAVQTGRIKKIIKPIKHVK